MAEPTTCDGCGKEAELQEINGLRVCNLCTQEALNRGTSLEDIHKTYQENYELKDTRRVDVALAVALATKQRGTPLWIIYVGASGDGKSEFLRPIQKWSHTFVMDNITKNTLLSGRHGANDLVLSLNNHLVLTYDMANLLSKDAKEKRAIFAQLRNIYDGKAYRATGSGKTSSYDGLYFN